MYRIIVAERVYTVSGSELAKLRKAGKNPVKDRTRMTALPPCMIYYGRLKQ